MDVMKFVNSKTELCFQKELMYCYNLSGYLEFIYCRCEIFVSFFKIANYFLALLHNTFSIFDENQHYGFY
jgi:hypothetical protein